MNYLDLVNSVLTLLREDTARDIGSGDAVEELVAMFINDAKRTVEDTHAWNALRTEWSETIPANAPSFALSDTKGVAATIQEVRVQGGALLQEVTNATLRQRKANSNGLAPASLYAVNGVARPSGNISVSVHPTSSTAQVVDVYGFSKEPDLVLASDETLLPSRPIIYLAYALASRERGEVGGQTSAEIFGMAGQYLKDAVAHDAALNQLEYNWYTV